jgi:hypothetical protein
VLLRPSGGTCERHHASAHGSPLCQDAAGRSGLGSKMAGPGSDWSEEPVWGCEPAALDFADAPWSSWARHRADGVFEHVPVVDVGQTPLEAAHRRHRRLAGGLLAVVVGASFGRIAQLDGGRDVQRPVDVPVPCSGQLVLDPVAGGRVERAVAFHEAKWPLLGKRVRWATSISSRAAPDGPMSCRSSSKVPVALTSSPSPLSAAFLRTWIRSRL